MILFYIFGTLYFFVSVFVLGELLTSNLPDTKFSKWWRKYVVYECQECE
jgi:hypothetical protein